MVELTNSEKPDAAQTSVTQFGNQKAMQPESWNNNFSMPVEEHKQALYIVRSEDIIWSTIILK